jgi:hypothetical protein
VFLPLKVKGASGGLGRAIALVRVSVVRTGQMTVRSDL